MASPEIEARLAELTRIGQTRELTDAEAKEALAMIRGDRISAAYASKAAKETKAKKTPSPTEALSKLQDLMKGG
jgi:hypothetical protein